MKKLTPILAVLCLSCNSVSNKPKNDIETFGVYPIKIDSCYYIVARVNEGVAIVHKQNCPNHITVTVNGKRFTYNIVP